LSSSCVADCKRDAISVSAIGLLMKEMIFLL
jgi:hypothetical protein